MAARAVTPAAIVSILSNGLTVAAAGAATGARCTGAGRAACCVPGAATGAAVVVRGAATGAAAPAGDLGAAGAGAGIPPGAPVGPPGGKVGNLIVGAADGLGGKVIRTVSFFG